MLGSTWHYSSALSTLACPPQVCNARLAQPSPVAESKLLELAIARGVPPPDPYKDWWLMELHPEEAGRAWSHLSSLDYALVLLTVRGGEGSGVGSRGSWPARHATSCHPQDTDCCGCPRTLTAAGADCCL